MNQANSNRMISKNPVKNSIADYKKLLANFLLRNNAEKTEEKQAETHNNTMAIFMGAEF